MEDALKKKDVEIATDNIDAQIKSARYEKKIEISKHK